MTDFDDRSRFGTDFFSNELIMLKRDYKMCHYILPKHGKPLVPSILFSEFSKFSSRRINPIEALTDIE